MKQKLKQEMKPKIRRRRALLSILLIVAMLMPLAVVEAAASGSAEGDTAAPTAREEEKYPETQNVTDSAYSDNRTDYAGDEVFANFRAMTGGKLRENTFFRGVSPVNNDHLRAGTADSLLRKNGVKYILDLSDSEETFLSCMEQADFSSDYAASLYRKGSIRFLALSDSYRSEEYTVSVARGLRDMMQHEGPYYIHGTEGKDRTGFVCILMEALAGASCEEIEADYMKTYDNYYGITKESQPEKYNELKEVLLYDMLYWLAGVPEGTDLTGMSFVEAAENYLRSGGMTDEEIGWFESFLAEEIMIVAYPAQEDLVIVDTYPSQENVSAIDSYPSQEDIVVVDTYPEGVFWVDTTNGTNVSTGTGNTNTANSTGNTNTANSTNSTGTAGTSGNTAETSAAGTSAASGYPDGVFVVTTPVPSGSSSSSGTASTSGSSASAQNSSAPTSEVFYVDIPDSTPVSSSSQSVTQYVSQPASQSSSQYYSVSQPSSTSSGSSGLSLSVSCGTAPVSSSAVNVTVTVYLYHGQMSSVSMPLTISLGGQSASLSASSVNGSGSTALGSYTFTVDLPEGESRSLPVSAAWAFNGTYSGQQVSTVTCSDTAYISR